MLCIKPELRVSGVSELKLYGASLKSCQVIRDKPLWPEETRKRKVIWPNRFEFDPIYLVPEEYWKEQAVKDDKLKVLARSGFQPLDTDIAEEIVNQFGPQKGKGQVVEKGKHDQIIEKIVQIGKMQRFIADKEYPMDGTRLDVVWRRVEEGSPTYVFEVQVGGDIYHALGKLKHAYDKWNSNTYLILSNEHRPEAEKLLSGTFHEIRERTKLIDLKQAEELFNLKKRYYDYEKQIGIL
ncbi:MAG: hypothetical protein QXX17_00065 [Conexivisphaerales archaeon]